MISPNKFIIDTLYNYRYEKIWCNFILYDDKNYPYLCGTAMLDINRDDILIESSFKDCKINSTNKKTIEINSKDYINRFYKCILTEFNKTNMKDELLQKTIQITFDKTQPSGDLTFTMNHDPAIIETRINTFYNDKGERFRIDIL